MESKLRLPSFANYKNLQVPEDPVAKVEPIPDNISLPELADQVLRGKRKLSRYQMRLLIELLPYHINKKPTKEGKDIDSAAKLDRELDKRKVYTAEWGKKRVEVD